MALKGKPKVYLKGKTYEEIYGVEKAAELKRLRREHAQQFPFFIPRFGSENPMFGLHQSRPSPLKGLTYEQIHGAEKSAELKQIRRQTVHLAREKCRKDKPTKPELKTAAILEKIGVDYESYAVIKPPHFIVDFRLGFLIIQIDGIYWHGHPRFEPLTKRQIAQKNRDKYQDACLCAMGYKVVRIWETDVTEDNLRAVLQEHHLL